MRTQLSGAALLVMIAGLAIWGLAFNVLYGLQALGCALGWNLVPFGPMSFHRAVLVGVLAAFVGVHGLTIKRIHDWRAATAMVDGRERLVTTASISNAWIGLFATLATGGPVLALTVCEAQQIG